MALDKLLEYYKKYTQINETYRELIMQDRTIIINSDSGNELKEKLRVDLTKLIKLNSKYNVLNTHTIDKISWLVKRMDSKDLHIIKFENNGEILVGYKSKKIIPEPGYVNMPFIIKYNNDTETIGLL